MTIKKQHLVWRKYLAPWTNCPETTRGRLYCYDIEKKKIRYQTIQDVGVERYAYDISMISESDKKIVAKYYEKWLNKVIKGCNLTVNIESSDDIFKKDYLENSFISPIEIKGLPMIEQLYNHIFPFDGPTELETNIDSLERHLLNNVLNGGEYDENTEELVQRRIEPEKESVLDPRYDFYKYLSVQMLRTWKAKKDILAAVQNTIEIFPNSQLINSTEALFPLMMITNSDILANALCKNNFYIILIDNDSEKNFLTCDYPVINLLANYKEKTNVNELIIYYPLKPRLAIICTKSINTNTIIKVKDTDVVDLCNKKIIDAATKQVYAKKIEDLERYGLKSIK